MLYSGEQFDPNLQMQYLRARYYDQNNGRFNRLDPFGGTRYDPQSLHKYGYAHCEPVMNYDPSGLFFTLIEQMVVGAMQQTLRGIRAVKHAVVQAYIKTMAYLATITAALQRGWRFFLNILTKLKNMPSNIWNQVKNVFFKSKDIISHAQSSQIGVKTQKTLITKWRQILGRIPSGTEIHHFVQQHKDNIARFGKESIHSVANSMPMTKRLHDVITRYTNSGWRKVPWMQEALYNRHTRVYEYLSSLSWEQQWRFGKAMYIYVIEKGTLQGFHPDMIDKLI